MSIFDEYKDLLDPNYVENYVVWDGPTVRNPDGPICELDVAVGLMQKNGNISKVSKMLRRSRRSVANFVARSVLLSDLQEDLYEEFLDGVEESARDLAEQKDPGFIKFVLSTKGKGRGYVTRNELTGKDGENMEVLFYIPENDRDPEAVEAKDE